MMASDKQFEELFNDSRFKCGGCESLFITLYQLHDHLRDHDEGGSYRYNHNTKTAFALPASCDASTQTCPADAVETEPIKIEHLDSFEGMTVQGITNQSAEILENTSMVDANEAYNEETDLESDNDSAEVGNENPDITADQSNRRTDITKASFNHVSVRRDEVGIISSCLVNDGAAKENVYTACASNDTLLECNKEKRHEGRDIGHVRTRKRNMDTAVAESKQYKRREIRVILTKLDDIVETKKVKTAKNKMVLKTEEQSYHVVSGENKTVNWQNDKLIDDVKTNDHTDSNSDNVSSVEKQNFKEKSCKICKRHFSFYSYLRRHCMEKHKLSLMRRPTKKSKKTQVSDDKNGSKEAASGIQCSECHKHFKSRKYLDRHLIKKHGFPRKKQGRPKKYDDPNGLYRCNKCDKILQMRQKSQHERYHRSGEGKSDVNTVVCDVCGLLFSKIGIVAHARAHSAGHLKCLHCNLEFNSIKELESHRYQVHYKKVAQCNVCGIVLASKKGLNQHVRSVHMQEKHSKCDICGMEFYQKAKMERHRLIHFDAQFQCSVCERKFKDEHSMKRHEKTHTRDVKYVCHICNHGFIQSTPYWVHMQKKHSLSKMQAMTMRQDLNSATMKPTYE